jgi:hypothetical protein
MSSSSPACLLADLATGLWRLRRRLVDAATGEPLQNMRRALRDVDMMLARLTEEEIEIQDHNGAVYDPSLSLRVAAFQPTAEIDRDHILETLKPSVYHHGERIQTGEVIVAIPEKKRT